MSVQLRLGTRGSQLALYQANAVAAALRQHAAVDCEIVVIRTSGDRLAEAPLSEIGGKRLFVKEIEDALLSGDIDLAVHSSKDMPAVLPPGLAIAAVLPREDARDAIVLPRPHDAGGTSPARADGMLSIEAVVAGLGQSPRIGTSSVRRVAQLTRLFPGASFAPIRGNLDTRLRKLDAGDYDAIVLAAAGLRRLGYQSRISACVPEEACVPAPGQGIIAIEIRDGDDALRATLAAIDDADARVALDAERAVVARLGGGCQMPIGAHAVVAAGVLALRAVVVSLDGARAIHAEARGATEVAAAVGAEAAARLLGDGAGEILAEAERAERPTGGMHP